MIRALGGFLFLGLAIMLPSRKRPRRTCSAARSSVARSAVSLAAHSGAIAGAAIGATTGAVIAAEAQRRSTGYYWWRGGCYYRYPNGAWLQVQPGYCAY
jgi:hypothetical protein